MDKTPHRRKEDNQPWYKTLNNTWQTLVLIVAIFAVGFTLYGQIESAVFTEEEITAIATQAAEQVIYEFEQKTALVDADDFMRGWIESENMTMDDYINNTYLYKTRVFKGGMMMVTNDYETRDHMANKYGDIVVADMVERLVRFEH